MHLRIVGQDQPSSRRAMPGQASPRDENQPLPYYTAHRIMLGLTSSFPSGFLVTCMASSMSWQPGGSTLIARSPRRSRLPTTSGSFTRHPESCHLFRARVKKSIMEGKTAGGTGVTVSRRRARYVCPIGRSIENNLGSTGLTICLGWNMGAKKN